MKEFTLDLPESLYGKLATLAESKGISMNQFLIYALIQTASKAHPVSDEEIKQQHIKYDAMLEELGTVNEKDFNLILAEGEEAEAQYVIDPDLKKRVEDMLNER